MPNLAWATPDEYPDPVDPPSPNPADLDGNGRVDGADLGLLFAAWGEDQPDLDGSGRVDGADLGILLLAWSPGG